MPRLSFKKANARRHELIDKKYRVGEELTEAEAAELERLQEFCGEWIDKRHPSPYPAMIAKMEAVLKELGVSVDD